MPEQASAGTVTPSPQPSFRDQVAAAEAADQKAAPEPQQAEPTPAPEPKQDGKEPDPPSTKVVPLAALHEERSARKELQRQIRESQQNFAALQQQQVEMMNYMRQFQPQQAAPDPAQDPLGAQLHATQQLNQRVDALTQNVQQTQVMQLQQQQEQQFRSAVMGLEAEFAKAQPDYHEAVTWARERKAAEYQAIGMDEDSARARVNHEARQIAQLAFQRGESPAETAWRLANAMGYKAKPKAPSDAERLAMQEQGQRAALPAGGGGPSGRLSLDALAKMDGKEFLEATSKGNWAKLMRALDKG